MIQRSKHIEALIRKHWRELIKGEGVLWLDGYNCSINKSVCGTIKTTIDTANLYFITEKTNDKADSNKFNQRR